MVLAVGQVQVRNLVMGVGTAYRVLPEFNPWERQVRADQGGPRAWSHGTWSGAEWADEAVVPIPLSVTGTSRSIDSWLAVHQPLAAAFAAVGDTAEQVQLRWRLGADEYVMFGRPRMAQPRAANIAVGKSATLCAFVAQDPRIYSGAESATSTGLTQFAGGLLVPFTVPVTVGGTLSGGVTTLVNAGTTDTGLTVRVDGPCESPRLVLQRPDGGTQTLEVDLTIGAGQWLDIDSVARTALLNGLATSNQFGVATWGWDQHPLPPGTTTLRFFAGSFQAAALATATWRSAYW